VLKTLLQFLPGAPVLEAIAGAFGVLRKVPTKVYLFGVDAVSVLMALALAGSHLDRLLIAISVVLMSVTAYGRGRLDAPPSAPQ
jgi:hypothetical protein